MKSKLQVIDWLMGFILMVGGSYLVTIDAKPVGVALVGGGAYLLGTTFGRENKK